MNSIDLETKSPVNRRSFLRFTALGAGTLVAISVAGKAMAQTVPIVCADPEMPVCPKPLVAALKPTISKNHGHTFVISLAELKANGAKSYDIKGASGHPHTVDITNDVLLALLLNNAVEIESTKDAGHTHIVHLEIVSV